MITIWAHRGASAYAPENTIAAFQKAVEMGAHGIEVDIHMSADGVPVAIHPRDVGKVSTGKGRVGDLNLTQLKKLSFSGAYQAEYPVESIPTLQEIYELLKPTGLKINVDIKTNLAPYPGLEKKLIALEKQMGMKGRVVYSSFNHFTLRTLKEIDPKSNIGLLYSNELVEPWNYAKFVGATALHAFASHLSAYPGYIDCAHACGLAVHVGTLDATNDIRQYIKLGVDGIFTNKPNVAVEELRRIQGEE